MATGTALFLALSIAAPGVKEKAPAVPAIVGEWQVVSWTAGGEVQPVSGRRLSVRADGGYVFFDGAGPAEVSGRRYTLNEKAALAEIDLAPRAAAVATGAAPHLGIFKIDGDTLTLCFSRSGSPRPAAFEAPAGTAVELYVFKRVSGK